MTECVGVDIGHGEVKVSFIENGNIKNISFPSVVAIADADLNLTNPEMIENGLVSFDGSPYFVGEMAMCTGENRLIRKRDDGDVNSPAWNALMRAALGIALRGKEVKSPVYVTSGLPVQFYNSPKSRESLCQAIEGINKFQLGKNNSYSIRTMAGCLPQSYATFLNEVFTINGVINEDCPFNPHASTGIVDVGEKTTDLVCIQGMNYIRHKAGSTNIGMRDAIKIICDEVMVDHNVIIPPNRRNAMIREIDGVPTLVANGKKTPIPDITSRALESVAGRVVDFVEGDWNLTEIETLITTGGGSLRLFNSMKKLSSTFHSAATLAKDGVFSNSNGYLKLSVMSAMVDKDEAKKKPELV